MKSGFVLIEILVASVIAGIISVMLFAAFNQINKSTYIIDEYVDTASKAAVFHHQFEKDLTGFFMPVASEKPPEEKKQAPATPQPGAQAQAQPELEKKEPVKQVTKVFYGAAKDKRFDSLTFITCNPLQVYWSANAGKAKPRIARVMYRLEQDKQNKNSFNLMRQEGQDLYIENYKPGGTKTIREYQMIDGIKSFAVEYWAVEQKKEEEKKPDAKKEYKKTTQWQPEDKEKAAQKKEDKKEDKKEPKKFPDMLHITLSLWDALKQRSVEYEFLIPLIADGKQPPLLRQPVLPSSKSEVEGFEGQAAQPQPTGPAGLALPQPPGQPVLMQQIDVPLRRFTMPQKINKSLTRTMGVR